MAEERDKLPLEAFLDEEPFTDIDRRMLSDSRLHSYAAGNAVSPQMAGAMRENDKMSDIKREMVAAAVSLFSARVAQREAESQDRHTKAMRGLTWALVVFTAVQVLDQIGLWSWLAARPWLAVWGWLTTLPSLVR